MGQRVVFVLMVMKQWKEHYYQISIVLILMNAWLLKIHARQIIGAKIWKVILNVSKKDKKMQNSVPKIIISQACGSVVKPYPRVWTEFSGQGTGLNS